MGLFDSTYAACPKCGKRHEVQTKVRCEMQRFDSADVPADIAQALVGEMFDCCGVQWRLDADIPRVRMRVQRVETEEYDGWDGVSYD